MRILLFLFVVTFGMAAQAQIPAQPECAMPQHSNAGADYVPGVDVDGRAVAPADLNAPVAAGIANPMVVPVTIDIAKRVGLSVQGLEMSGNTGFLEIFQDGRVLYNGQDLTQKVNVACGRVVETAPPVPAQKPSFDPDRQTVTQDIEYAPKPAAPVSKVPEGELIEGGEFAN